MIYIYVKFQVEQDSCRNMDTIKLYFLGYNTISLWGWIYLFTLIYSNLVLIVPLRVSTASQADFKNFIQFYYATIDTLILVQLFQILEIIHSLLGITRSNPVLTFAQVGGRLHCLYLAILCYVIWADLAIYLYPCTKE